MSRAKDAISCGVRYQPPSQMKERIPCYLEFGPGAVFILDRVRGPLDKNILAIEPGRFPDVRAERSTVGGTRIARRWNSTACGWLGREIHLIVHRVVAPKALASFESLCVIRLLGRD